jgi:hypothetical protein
MASLLVGGYAYACIDETDGARMNIMDIDSGHGPAAAGEDALQVLWLFASTT